MKNATTTNKATSTPAKKVAEKKSELKSINFALFADKVKNVEEKTKKDRTLIYRYPETFTKEVINSDKGKKFRQTLRNKLSRFENNISVFYKIKDAEKLTNEINAFEAFYKEGYLINDFSLKSLSNSEKNSESLSLMLEIIKAVKG